MPVSLPRARRLAPFVVALAVLVARPAPGQTAAAAADAAPVPALVPADEFSPAFLGMYRKLTEIDGAIGRYSRKYGVDPLLARAVCMYESGGNANLTSGAGARGYFQVMPATFRLMRVSTNIEAGIKYLSQLVRQFGREDYALAAYNGGPGRVARGRAMPLESLQYVLGVGYYRSVLKVHEPSVRRQAARLGIVVSRRGENWTALSQRLHVPRLLLRLYNPFLTDSRLRRTSYLVAYPTGPVKSVVEVADDGRREYRARIGDNYIALAFAFDVDVDRLRSANGLWRLQVLPADLMLTIPSGTDTLTAERSRTSDVEAASEPAAVPAPVRLAVERLSFSVHLVRRGDTLTALARRYGTSVRAIQGANRMGRRTRIQIGQRLRIPAE